MTSNSSVVLAGLAPDVAQVIEDRLGQANVAIARSVDELADLLGSSPVTLLVLADGLDRREASDIYHDLIELNHRKPVRTWCCVSSKSGAGAIAELANKKVDRIFFLPLDREEIVREAARALGIEISPSDAPDTARNAIALSAVWSRFRESTLSRIDILESAALNLLSGKLTDEERRNAERETHKLAGSAGTFGFPKSSRIARDLENRFASNQLQPADAVPISEQLIELRHDLEGTPVATAEGQGARTHSGRRLLLLSDDEVFNSRLGMEAEARDLQLTWTGDIGIARAKALEEQPAMAIVSLPVKEGRDEVLDFVQELEGRVPSIPVVVLSAASDFRARVDVARRGAHGFLEQPIGPSKTIDFVVAAFEHLTGSRATILALDDDPQMLESVRALLEPVGMRVVTVDNPLHLWEAIEESSPDLVLLDIDMPYVSGFELCRALRQDTRWSRLPILFVTARNDAESIQRAFSAGADDFIRKPIIAAELLMRINSRLDRARLNRELAETDALTGVANRRKTAEILERFIRLARRKGDPFSLAIIDLDHFKQVNDRFGHAAGDDVLRGISQYIAKSLRPEDVIGRWGGEEFLLGLYGVRKSEAAARLRVVLDRFSGSSFASDKGDVFQVTFSAGIAQFPADGSELESLRNAADNALYQAKAAGRNAVRLAGAAEGSVTQNVDVAIVDDDEALAGLLTHSLKTHQISSITFHSGDTAVAELAGTAPRITAKVILLDVDLPAMSGLDVLRVLSLEKITAGTRVIMLTARSGERDILTALELGATDHITKPFSVAVLIQKVRVALRDASP